MSKKEAILREFKKLKVNKKQEVVSLLKRQSACTSKHHQVGIRPS